MKAELAKYSLTIAAATGNLDRIKAHLRMGEGELRCPDRVCVRYCERVHMEALRDGLLRCTGARESIIFINLRVCTRTRVSRRALAH